MSETQNVTGRSLLAAGWSVLRADRELLALPVIGTVTALLALLPTIILFIVVPSESTNAQWAIGVLAAFTTALVSTFFSVALAAGANARLDGGDPTVRSALNAAWLRRGAILQWALLATLVGALLRLIEQRFAFAGKLIAALGDLTWAVASYFAVPVLATEDVTGWGALKKSSVTMRERFGKVVRIEVRGLLIGLAMVLMFFGTVFFAVINFESSPTLSITLLILSVVTLVAAALVLNAIMAIARVALYRYASGRPVPGFSNDTLEKAIKTAN